MATAGEPRGLQWPLDMTGRRASAPPGQRIAAAALRVLDGPGADALLQERDWRHRYPQHLKRLVECQAAAPARVVASCRAGLDAAWAELPFLVAGGPLPLREAMARPQGAALRSLTLRGEGPPQPARWEVPLGGRRLSGDALARQIDRWEQGRIAEPGCAAALRRALAHPEWFDLSDRSLVLLGAGSEAGPLEWLARWRARIVAVDLPRAAIWQRIVQRVRAGNATLLAPTTAADDDLQHAGADLLTQTPEIAAWLGALAQPLDIGALAYLDGERHVRVSLAMDAIAATLVAADARHTLAWMATPTDVFAVPEALAADVQGQLAERGSVKRLAQAALHLGSGGRSFAPHIETLVADDAGRRWGVVDALVIEQGPNYALAKRLQQWRAVVARAAGTLASLNVAPSTSTASVLSNPALAAGFRGAKAFDVEVFEPDTTHALMAALWVHDLRCPDSPARPEEAAAHPLEPLVRQANHGGLWRLPYLPRSVLPLAALLGFVTPRG